jgi:hypothetical protein
VIGRTGVLVQRAATSVFAAAKLYNMVTHLASDVKHEIQRKLTFVRVSAKKRDIAY